MKNIITNTTTTTQSANPNLNTKIVQQAKSEQWLTENKNALEAYNRRIAASGTFSDGLRRF